jgi:hypothetical protein
VPKSGDTEPPFNGNEFLSHVTYFGTRKVGETPLLTLELAVLYASISAAKAALRAFPVELSPLASMLFSLDGNQDQ